MAKKGSSMFLKGLMELCEVHSSKTLRGNNARKINVRQLGAHDSSAANKKTPVTTVPSPPARNPLTRGFLNLAASASARRMEHRECRVLGYSPEQLYDVVANVDQYQNFVPWCRKSRFIKRHTGDFKAELEIGFPPLVERYTSDLTFVPNRKISAVCTDGSLFRHLETVWDFAPGDKDSTTCKVQFQVSFEFKSVLHSHLASAFFDEVAKQMVGAFELRASKLYGKPPPPADARPRYL